jgi:hypothetical protein
MYPNTRQAVKILINGLIRIPIPFFKRAGKIPSSPAVLNGPKPSIAHLILTLDIFLDASSQSPSFGCSTLEPVQL